jgi:putative hydrolase of HD superfamily
MSLDRDIQFLYEVGSLRYIPRMWHRYSNTDFANITEHHFRVIWIALMIAAHEKTGDTGKIVKMALVHDIAESRAGDVDDIARQYVERKQELGIEDMLGDTELADEFLKLWHEYEKRQSIESKIVKDADNIDVDLELMEQKAKGSTLPDALAETRQVVAKNKLYTKSAKKIWNTLIESSPHDWHRKGRNRLNSGDWKS